jgi:hypothetical protein
MPCKRLTWAVLLPDYNALTRLIWEMWGKGSDTRNA